MLEQLRLAGLLHDLGKIATPDSILQQARRARAKRSPRCCAAIAELGYRLVEGLDVSPVDCGSAITTRPGTAAAIRYGLAGDDIPLGSRIILVADAFDAMTTERAYRSGISSEAAIAELRRCSWTQFDARVVAALERCLSQLAPHLAASRLMVLLLPSSVGLIVGSRGWGPPDRIAELRCVGTALLRRGFVLQVIAFPSGILPFAVADGVATTLWLCSYALLVALALLNRRVRGFPLASAGMFSNLAAVLANHGHMPALPSALPTRACRSSACTTTAWSPTTRISPGSSTAGERPSGCRSRTSTRSATCCSPWAPS